MDSDRFMKAEHICAHLSCNVLIDIDTLYISMLPFEQFNFKCCIFILFILHLTAEERQKWPQQKNNVPLNIIAINYFSLHRCCLTCRFLPGFCVFNLKDPY